MSNQFRKIKYEEESEYGTTKERYLFVWSHDTCDVVRVFDDVGNELFSYSETGFDMGQALAIIGTDWQNERMEKMDQEEKDLIMKSCKNG
jgi:hypothetical protein